jgi:peptidyl-prolyl cis-trans isomerase SurA
MSFKKIQFLFIAFVSVNSVSAQVKPVLEDVTVFTIGKKPVMADEFIYLYKKNHQNKKEEFTTAKVEEYLDLFINFKLKVTEAQARGIDTTQSFKTEYNSYKDELRKPYLPDSKLLDSLVHLTYNRLKEEVNASHILIGVKENAGPADTLVAYNKIMEIRKRAMSGEDFGTLAQQYSEDPSAKTNKGDLGYFTSLQMVYPFETAAYTTKKGEISLPVRTRFGYHILRVNDRRPAKGEVEVSHIMVRTGENKDNAKSKNTIFEIYDELQKGVDWNDLCKQYSEDPSSKDSGGKLRPFSSGMMATVPEFERVAFELKNPGDISDPVQTQFGWHIIKLDQKIPLGSYDDLASALKGKVSRDERVQVSKHAVYEKLKREYHFVESAQVKNKLFSLADSTLINGNWFPKFDNGAKSVLFSLDGKNFFVNDFINYVHYNHKPTALEPAAYIKQLYNAYADAQLTDALEQKIASRYPEYKWLLREYYEGILLFDIMEKEVWNKASEDSVGQREYFEQHKDTFKAGERVSATIYSATTAEHIDELKSLLEKNDTASVRKSIAAHKIKVEEGAYEKDDRIVLGKVEWRPGIHSATNNNLSYVVVISKILPPGNKTFEEARPEVISEYQSFLEKKWIAVLRKKYPVKINKKGKEIVVNQLVNEAIQ